MTPRKTKQHSHCGIPSVKVRTYCSTTIRCRTQIFRTRDEIRFRDAPCAALKQIASSACQCEQHDGDHCNQRERAAGQWHSIFQSVFVLRKNGASTCMEPYRSVPLRHAKPSVTIVSRPTYLSVTCFPTSRNGFFGLRIQHPGSLRRLAAACAKLSDISVVMNGLAMLSPRSWPKSSNVAACATSRSFPNGSRRPF